MDILQISLACVFGLVIGSFLNVVILRLPEGRKLSGRSQCPKCQRVLEGSDLIPVVSFLWLNGKCRSCGHKISWRYPLIEAVTALLFAGVWYWISPEGWVGYLMVVKAWVLVSILMAVFVIDLEHYLILDSVLLAGGLPTALLNFLLDMLEKRSWLSWSSHLTGGLVAGLAAAIPFYFFWRFSNGKWMGFGDIKFALFLGLSLGWPSVWVAWLGAFFLGSLYALPLLALKKKRLSSQLPFGTFLSVAALLAWLWGEKIIVWYLRLLGV